MIINFLIIIQGYKMKKLVTCVLAGALALTMVSSAFANTMENNQAQEVIVKNNLSELKKSYRRAEKYKLPRDGEKTIEIGVDVPEFLVELPVDYSESNGQKKVSREHVVYQDGTGKFANDVKITELGMEILTVLNSEGAPSTYEFKTDALAGVRLEKSAISEDVILAYSNGLVVAVFENSFAKDAAGKEIKTDLSIRDNVIVQSINIKENDVVYPVTSGMNIYSTRSAQDLLDWFNDAHWIWRGSELSLRLYPKDWCKQANITTALKETTWAAVYNYFHTESYWDNSEGMRQQYLCHVDFAKYENNWNLEPWRPNVGYNATVAAGCNPV